MLVVLLEVLVGEESEGAADQDDGVQADAHVGLLGAAGASLGGGLLGFGGRVIGLVWLVVSVMGRFGICGVFCAVPRRVLVLHEMIWSCAESWGEIEHVHRA